MFGLGGPKRPKMVAFDIIGTVFPLEPLRASIVALGLPSAALEGWFAAGRRDGGAGAGRGARRPKGRARCPIGGRGGARRRRGRCACTRARAR